MKKWNQSFASDDLFFVAPDIKRGLGLEDLLPNYHLICSYNDPLIPTLRRQGANIFCLEEEIENRALPVNNSGTLLTHPRVAEYISKHTRFRPWIMYFKPSLKLDLLIKDKGYSAIGNSAELNEKFENKINFFALCRKYFSKYSVPAKIGVLGKLEYKDLVKILSLPFVVQFGHGWAGKTTYFINTEKEFNELSVKFAATRVKASKKIKGFTVLNNCCIYRDSVLIGPPAIQLSDIPILDSKPGITCGRQWPVKFLEKTQIKEIEYLSGKIGLLMKKISFKGLFGLDFLIDESSGKIYFSEINARLTASTSFYTYLERGIKKIPLLAYHIASFVGRNISPPKKNQDEIIGSQVIFRSSNVLPGVFKKVDFGLYTRSKQKLERLKTEYYPQRLKNNEFIYIAKLNRSKKDNHEELGRMEMKDDVMETPYKLRSWFMEILTSKE